MLFFTEIQVSSFELRYFATNKELSVALGRERAIHRDGSGSRTDTETSLEQKEQSPLWSEAWIGTALRELS